jgi:hypothetical protein
MGGVSNKSFQDRRGYRKIGVIALVRGPLKRIWILRDCLGER